MTEESFMLWNKLEEEFVEGLLLNIDSLCQRPVSVIFGTHIELPMSDKDDMTSCPSYFLFMNK